MKPITEMTAAEIVAEFNDHAETPVKKFSDRKTAERRLNEQRAQREAAKSADKPAQRIQHKVSVRGEEYRSVRQAFAALELPDSKHIKFRLKLKAAGTAMFEHDGVQYFFTLVPR